MTKLASLLFTASLLVLLLAGCNIRPPFTVFISAANYGAESSLGDKNTYCTGGLKTRVAVDSVVAKTSLAPLGDGTGTDFLMPETAPAGTEMTTEAWCYGEGGEEVAYARVTRPYSYAQILSIIVRAPSTLYPYEPGVGICSKLTEQRGPPICIASDLF